MLRRGNTGSEVVELQQFLIDQGYDLGTFGADGIFGRLTDAAVRAYQSANDLKVDGIVGPNTREAIGGTGTDDDPAPDDDPTPDIDPIDDFERQREGTVTVGDAVIPAGMRLIRITGPSGSDAGTIFVLVGDVYGVETGYEIGDIERLEDLFGGVASFGSVETMTQQQYDASDILDVGSVDEILGSTESRQAQAERDMRAAGLEAPPPWMLNDRQAMLTFITGVNEGWSTDRTWKSLSTLSSFTQRFPGLDTVMTQVGTVSLTAGIGEFLARENQIRTALTASRGPATDISQQYVTSLIASGWQAAEIEELLQVESRVRGNPGAIDNINEILEFQKLPPITADDFVEFLRGQDALTLDPSHTPSAVFEGINDALRFQALLTEGIEITPELATELGTGVSTEIEKVEAFSGQAQLAAGYIARNAKELNFEKLGLTRADIVSASFGESPEDGKTVAEVNSILEKFARERSKAAEGFSGSQSFTDQSGRLRIQGFADLT